MSLIEDFFEIEGCDYNYQLLRSTIDRIQNSKQSQVEEISFSTFCVKCDPLTATVSIYFDGDDENVIYSFDEFYSIIKQYELR